MSKSKLEQMTISSLMTAIFCLASCDRPTITARIGNEFGAKNAKSCQLLLDTNKSDHPNMAILNISRTRKFFSCPFVHHIDKYATAYVVEDRTEFCDKENLSGIKVISRRLMTAESALAMARSCNPALHNVDKNTPRKIYIWTGLKNAQSAATSRDDAAITEGDLDLLLMESALPILKLERSSEVLCFEVSPNERKGPIELFKLISYTPPVTVKEGQVQDPDCDAALLRVSGKLSSRLLN